MALTVGDVLDYLRGCDRADPVEVHFMGPDVFLHVPSEYLSIGTGQGGPTGDDVVVQISREPPPAEAG